MDNNSNDENNEALEDEYVVEKILDKKKFGNVYKYLIKWEGYPHDSNTWEPIEHLMGVKILVDQFEAKLKKKDENKNGTLKKSVKPSSELLESNKNDANDECLNGENKFTNKQKTYLFQINNSGKTERNPREKTTVLKEKNEDSDFSK